MQHSQMFGPFPNALLLLSHDKCSESFSLWNFLVVLRIGDCFCHQRGTQDSERP